MADMSCVQEVSIWDHQALWCHTGVKEAIYITTATPFLIDRGRHQLPVVYHSLVDLPLVWTVQSTLST